VHRGDGIAAARVSFVIAAWKPNPGWLATAVGAVLAQEGCEVEAIVVDDGCPEPVAPLLAPLEDERLKVIRIEHGGEAAARNAGIEAASGDWFRFVDADDRLEWGSTARLLALAQGRTDVIAYGATMFCDDELRPLWKLTCRIQGAAREACLLGRLTVRPFSLLFPRAVVEATGGWDPEFRVSQDWDYVLRALDHAEVSGETQVATYYRKHASSATADIGAGERGGRRVLDKYFARHPEERGTRLERRAEARLRAMLARAHASHGQPRHALRDLGRALWLDPRSVGAELGDVAPALAARARSAVR
jgi:glycosyltransferase involved in cell wall biosynthesis